MQRLFIQGVCAKGGRVVINDLKQVHHVTQVLRCKPGDTLIVCDEKKNEFLCVIHASSGDALECAVIDTYTKPDKKEEVYLAVACAIPKNSRVDDAINKLTQIGVNRIIPMITQRVIVKIRKEKAGARLHRWKTIAESASEQCQRTDIPLVDEATDFFRVLELSDEFDLKLICALIDERKPLREVLDAAHAKKIMVVIGPEGDFTPDEVCLAKQKGFVPVTLGATVLRVETAAVAVASFIRLYSL